MMSRPAQGARFDGRYELTAPVGEGSFGWVWRAHDTRLAGRDVAVKILKPEFSESATAVARFDAEVAALAQLSHPNIVAVLDRGTWDGHRFIVTELIEGPSLARWLGDQRRGGERASLHRVLSLFDQVCAGLGAAHAVRSPGPIVHRDVKPDNLLLQVVHGGARLVKIVDFGIAQLGRRNGTVTGVLLGTPLYMAPEQARGFNSGVGPWTDVFALGVLLVEMLSLDAHAGSEEEPWWSFSMAHPGAVRARLDALRPEVAPPVWDLAARCLARECNDRFADAGALREALRAMAPRVLDGRPLSEAPWPSPSPRVVSSSTALTVPDPPGARPPEVAPPAADVPTLLERLEAPTHEAPTRALPPASERPREAPDAPAAPTQERTPTEDVPAAPPWGQRVGRVALGAVVLAAAVTVLVVSIDPEHGPSRTHAAAPPRSAAAVVPAPPGAPVVPDPAAVHPALAAVRPAEPAARPIAEVSGLGDFLRGFERAVARGDDAPSLASVYAPRVRWNGSPRDATPDDLARSIDTNRANGATLTFDWDRSECAPEAPDAPDVASACRDMAGARGAVMKVRAWAVEVRPDRHPSIGCARLEGRYLLRLRDTPAGWRVCHESWSVQDGICASCPTATVCGLRPPER